MPDPLKLQFPSQGWTQLLSVRRELLDAFDRAREKAKIHEVETHHGRVAEAVFRKWLYGFLPKRYGVTSGYIVSPGLSANSKTPHFDVIVYDRLESPVLWIEENPDSSAQGRSLAIPVEYVNAVLEVKSSLSTATVGDAIEHLGDLSPLMGSTDHPEERYRCHLTNTFCCGIVFFEIRKQHQFSEDALARMLQGLKLRGFFGGLVLRGEGLQESQSSGRIQLLKSETPIDSTIGPNKGSLLHGAALCKSEPLGLDAHVSSMLLWSEMAFAQFAFDLIALMQGRFEAGRLSSWYGVGASSWEDKW